LKIDKASPWAIISSAQQYAAHQTQPINKRGKRSNRSTGATEKALTFLLANKGAFYSIKDICREVFGCKYEYAQAKSLYALLSKSAILDKRLKKKTGGPGKGFSHWGWFE
ncbi:MAG: hypothetical protein ACRCWJ_11685, partial [Casimicrobium sp.]